MIDMRTANFDIGIMHKQAIKGHMMDDKEPRIHIILLFSSKY